MERRNIDKIILSTLTGVASGAILGLLFAPDKGSETRKKISKQSDKYLKKVKNDTEELREYLNERTEKARARINELGKEVKARGDGMLKKAGNKISYEEWTKEELYEKAKEEHIDGYSQMNKNELIDALKKS